MRKTSIVLVFLAATALGACSGGQGPGGTASGNPPTAQPPPAPPPAPAPDLRTEPPFPTLPLPPVETLSCSPCKKIAFVSTRDGNYEIYSVNADGTEIARLTDNPSVDHAPAWSPDGRRIAFVSDRDFDGDSDDWPRSELYVMDADGGNVERLTFSESGAWHPAWSPDGSRITYHTHSDGSSNLWEVSAEGGTFRLLFSSPGFDGQPAWSLDGTRLAIVSDWFAYDFVSDVFLINADGSGFTALTDGIIFDDVNYYYPSWSPTEDRIALIVQRDFFAGEDYVNWLGVMNADGSGLTLLLTPLLASSSPGRTYPTEYFYDPSWSSDGTTIAYTHFIYGGNDSGRYDVSWVKADGSARGTIITNGWDPDWQR